MISINKQGNAIVIEFTDNDKYLFNGKIEVAPNELIVVVDQSDMVTFKRASNGDVLFSQLVDDIQIAGSPVTKDTVIDQFALIGFTSGGGGGAGGAVSSVNGQTGDVIITPASLNVYTRAEVDAAINAETTERQKQDSALGGMIAAETAARERAVATKQDTLVSGTNIKTINGQSVLGAGNIAIQGGTSNWDDITGKPEFAEVATSGSYNDLTNKPEIPSDYIENITDSDTEFSIDTAFNYKSGKKYSLSFSKTGGFDVIIGGVGDTQRKINLSIDTDIIATKEDLADYQPVGDYATKTELASKQDTLVSGTNIKTINGQTLLGEGNIEIQGGGTITVDSELSTTSENPVQNKVITNAINGKQDAGDYALKSEIPDTSELATKEELAAKLDTATYNSEKANFETKENAAATYQVKGDYATTAQLNSKQDTLVSGTNIKTINGNSLLGEGDITIQAGGGVGQTYPGSTNGEIFNDYEGNQASGQYSHAEGSITRAIGDYTHTEGWNCSTEGNYSHAEGEASRTGGYGNAAHAEGGYTVALGLYSHTEGSYTTASGTNTHAEGDHTKTTNNAEHSQGKYNKSNTGATENLKTIHSIGIGANEEGRKNAQEVMTNGDHYIIGIGGYDGTNPETAQTLQEVVNSGGSSVVVDTEMSDTSENAVQNKVIKKYIDDLVGNILTQLQEINGTN